MQLSGSNVIVTGASRGLGRALAEVLAARGARVVLVARDEEKLEEVIAAIRARGHTAHAFGADVGERDAAARIAGAAAAMAGPIDIVVHNASTLGPVPLASLADTASADFERALAVNLVGPFRLTRALLGPMIQRGRGLIVHISSDAALEAYPSWGAYGASKAALDHLSRTWAAELAGTGVRALSIDPGEMDTLMHAQAIPDADRASLARPEDVAKRVAFAIEHEASTGSRLLASQVAL